MAEAGTLPLANMLHHCEQRHTDGGGGATHLDTALKGHPDTGCLFNNSGNKDIYHALCFCLTESGDISVGAETLYFCLCSI